MSQIPSSMPTCCHGNCHQGRNCPRRLQPQPQRKPLRLAADVLERGTRRGVGARYKRVLRSLWRFLAGPSPW